MLQIKMNNTTHTIDLQDDKLKEFIRQQNIALLRLICIKHNLDFNTLKKSIV